MSCIVKHKRIATTIYKHHYILSLSPRVHLLWRREVTAVRRCIYVIKVKAITQNL